jgi:hypothetical protein
LELRDTKSKTPRLKRLIGNRLDVLSTQQGLRDNKQLLCLSRLLSKIAISTGFHDRTKGSMGVPTQTFVQELSSHIDPVTSNFPIFQKYNPYKNVKVMP